MGDGLSTVADAVDNPALTEAVGHVAPPLGMVTNAVETYDAVKSGVGHEKTHHALTQESAKATLDGDGDARRYIDNEKHQQAVNLTQDVAEGTTSALSGGASLATMIDPAAAPAKIVASLAKGGVALGEEVHDEHKAQKITEKREQVEQPGEHVEDKKYLVRHDPSFGVDAPIVAAHGDDVEQKERAQQVMSNVGVKEETVLEGLPRTQKKELAEKLDVDTEQEPKLAKVKHKLKSFKDKALDHLGHGHDRKEGGDGDGKGGGGSAELFG